MQVVVLISFSFLLRRKTLSVAELRCKLSFCQRYSEAVKTSKSEKIIVAGNKIFRMDNINFTFDACATKLATFVALVL